MDNVITLNKLLLLFCPPTSLFCFLKLQNTKNELATIFIVYIENASLLLQQMLLHMNKYWRCINNCPGITTDLQNNNLFVQVLVHKHNNIYYALYGYSTEY